MLNIKTYTTKLHHLKNTEKITRTMKLISMSKLAKAHDAQKKAKLYARNLKGLIKRLTIAIPSETHPLFQKRTEVKKVLVFVITSDKGLCGSFNNHLNKSVHTWLQENRDIYQDIHLSFCGKRGWMHLKEHLPVRKYYEQASAKPNFEMATRIGKECTEDFLSGQYDEIYLAYNIFHNPLSQHPAFEKIVPVEADPLIEKADEFSPEYIFEPEARELLRFLIPRYLYFRIYYALLENSAGEHSARTAAMDSASKNAAELIDRYTVLKNRARQAMITNELIEIAAGAESLHAKGYSP